MLCPLLHGNDLGLSLGPNLSRANLLDAQTGLEQARRHNLHYIDKQNGREGKGRGGGGKQQRTQLFLLSYTRSTNLPALTLSAPSSPHRHAHIGDLPPAFQPDGGAHC